MAKNVDNGTPAEESNDRPVMKWNGEIVGKLPRKMAKTTRTRYDSDHWLTETDYAYRCDHLCNDNLGLWLLNRKELHEDVQNHFLNFSYRGCGFYALEVKDAPIPSAEVATVEKPADTLLTFPEKVALVRLSKTPVSSVSELRWANPLINYLPVFGALTGMMLHFGAFVGVAYIAAMIAFVVLTFVGRHRLNVKFDGGGSINPRKEIGDVRLPLPAGKELIVITQALGEKLKTVLRKLPDDTNLHFLIGYKFETDDRVAEISKWLGIVEKLYAEDAEFPVDCVPLLAHDVKITLEKLIEAKALNAQFEKEVLTGRTEALKEFGVAESAATLKRSLKYLENYSG